MSVFISIFFGTKEIGPIDAYAFEKTIVVTTIRILIFFQYFIDMHACIWTQIMPRFPFGDLLNGLHGIHLRLEIKSSLLFGLGGDGCALHAIANFVDFSRARPVFLRLTYR